MNLVSKSLFGSHQDEFPAVLPDQEEEWTFGRHRVRTLSIQPYSQSLLQARVTVTNPQVRSCGS